MCKFRIKSRLLMIEHRIHQQKNDVDTLDRMQRTVGTKIAASDEHIGQRGKKRHANQMHNFLFIEHTNLIRPTSSISPRIENIADFQAPQFPRVVSATTPRSFENCPNSHNKLTKFLYETSLTLWPRHFGRTYRQFSTIAGLSSAEYFSP